MSKFLLAIACATAILVPAALSQEKKPDPKPAAQEKPLPKAEDVLEAHITATGGRANWEKVTSMVMLLEGKMGAPMEMVITRTMKSKAPDRSSVHQVMGKMGELREGYDGKVAWASDQTGTRELEGGQKAFTARGPIYYRGLRWKELYKEVRSKAFAKVDGKDCVVVELIPRDGEGSPEIQTFDLASKLLCRWEEEKETQMGPQKITFSPTEYKEVSGVKIAHSLKVSPGPVTFVMKVKKIELNVPVDDADFTMPVAKPKAEK